MIVGDSLVLVWTSVVEVESLGLLLGRDFLEAIGGVMSFTRRAIRADHLDGKRIPLRQLAAGHFYLDIFPGKAIDVGQGRWTRQGQDGFLKCKCLMLSGLAEELKHLSHSNLGAEFMSSCFLKFAAAAPLCRLQQR